MQPADMQRRRPAGSPPLQGSSAIPCPKASLEIASHSAFVYRTNIYIYDSVVDVSLFSSFVLNTRLFKTPKCPQLQPGNHLCVHNVFHLLTETQRKQPGVPLSCSITPEQPGMPPSRRLSPWWQCSPLPVPSPAPNGGLFCSKPPTWIRSSLPTMVEVSS